MALYAASFRAQKQTPTVAPIGPLKRWDLGHRIGHRNGFDRIGRLGKRTQDQCQPEEPTHFETANHDKTALGKERTIEAPQGPKRSTIPTGRIDRHRLIVRLIVRRNLTDSNHSKSPFEVLKNPQRIPQ